MVNKISKEILKISILHHPIVCMHLSAFCIISVSYTKIMILHSPKTVIILYYFILAVVVGGFLFTNVRMLSFCWVGKVPLVSIQHAGAKQAHVRRCLLLTVESSLCLNAACAEIC